MPKVEDQKPEILADGTTALDSSGLADDNAVALLNSNDLTAAADDDDDDSDIEVLESVSFMESEKVEDSFMNSPASTSAAMGSMDRRPDQQSFVPVDVSQNQMKIDALRSIENPLLAFQKVRLLSFVGIGFWNF